MMRLTSIALVPLTIAFVWIVLSLLSKDYNGVRAELGHPLPAIFIVLFLVAGVYHMELGMRSVIVDYIHGRRARMGADRQHSVLDRARGRLRLRDPAHRVRLKSSRIEAMATNGSNGSASPAVNGKAYPINDHTFDVVVVGAGGAGLRAASAALRPA